MYKIKCQYELRPDHISVQALDISASSFVFQIVLLMSRQFDSRIVVEVNNLQMP